MPISETVLILMLLLAMGMVTTGLAHRLPVPYTVLLVVIGLLLSELSKTVVWMAPLSNFSLTPDLVLFIFLPTLIFESGLNLDSRLLIKNIAPVLALAIPALLVSTFIIGFGVAQLLPISLGMALVFGALISATDPVAVVALFKELGTSQRLTTLVEGESLLNDATAIVLVHILLGLAMAGGFGAGDFALAVVSFVKVFFGGVLVGVLFGWLFGWLMLRLRVGSSAVLILSLAMAYLCFIVAEHELHVSGVMAVAVGAVTLGVYGLPRQPREVNVALAETWEFLALACNTLLFLMIGFVVDIWHVLASWDVILLTVVLLLLARASMIYTLVPLTTRLFKLPKVTMGERHIMWWGGLKGGLAIAIVLAIPEHLAGRQILLDVTLGVVVFTLLVNAPTIRPLIARLGLDRLTNDERAEQAYAMNHAREVAVDTLQQFLDAGVLSRAAHHQSLGRLNEALGGDDKDLKEEHRYRRHRLNALRREKLTLENLYKGGMMPYYIFIDLKGELSRAREYIVGVEAETPSLSPRWDNPFLRLEHSLVSRLREVDWMAGILSRYQDLRLSQHLLKDVVHIFMARAALDYVRSEAEMDRALRLKLSGVYQRYLQHFQVSVSDIQEHYPNFYARFESRLSLRTALVTALRNIDKEGHQGALGAKPWAQLEQLLTTELALIPPRFSKRPNLKPLELLKIIPLFEGLGEDALNSIADRMSPVNYLADDTVIGEGEHGDALYVIVSGSLVAFKKHIDGGQKELRDLRDGDFFGELALLGEHIRTASVVARHSSALLRLRRTDVLDIAAKYPQVEERLKQVQSERS